MSGQALAADLGGGCCADLEARVAELEATTARKGNRQVSLTVSGQVTQALMFWDDGEDSDVFVVDPQTSNSRFRFTGSAAVSPNLTAGFNIEIEGLLAPSNTVEQDDDDGGVPADGAVEMRLAYWYLNHKQLGRLSVGRLAMATDGVAQIDLGGANIVAQSGLYYANNFIVQGDGGRWSDFMVGNFEFDRNNAVRYDTPTFAGFGLSTSWGEDDRWDVTARYAGEFSGFRLAAGIGYGVDTDEISPDERQILTGSASILHVDTGLFLSGHVGERSRDSDPDDEFSWSLRGGVSKNWTGLGKTVLYGEYHAFENRFEEESEIWGVGVVQNIDAAAMELFLAYKNYSVDEPDAEDLDLVITGARIRF